MRSRTNPYSSALRAVIAAILGALIAQASATDSTVPRPAAESSTDRENPTGADKNSGIWQTDYKGFPTYVLLDPAGTEMRRQVGYLEGGPKEFIKWAQSGN